MHSEPLGTGASCTGATLDPSAPYVPVAGPAAAERAQVPNLPPGSFNVDWLRSCADGAAAAIEGMPCKPEGTEDFYSSAPRSSHPGGVIAAHVDGSVTFLADNIQAQALALAVCIDDGQVGENP